MVATSELDRLGIELVAARGNGFLALTIERIGGHADDRDVSGLGILLEASHHIQRSASGISRSMVKEALLTIIRRENLEATDPFKSYFEHVEVVLVVFDVEHFSHVIPFIRSSRRRPRAACPAR